MPSAAARFVCSTSPLEPPPSVGQPHFLPPPRPTGVLVFDGCRWNAFASASACCLLPAFCAATCTPPPPTCDWSVDCVVPFRFAAIPAASAALVWVTEPPPPPEPPIETGVLVLVGLICTAL